MTDLKLPVNGTEPIQLTRKDFVSDQEVRWCPGCGDYSILAQTQKVMTDFGYPRENILFISGIGCSGRLPYQSQRRFEHRCRAATIIVDARSLQHAVEMRTNDNQGTIATGGRVGQYVSAPTLFGHGVDRETHGCTICPSCDVEGVAVFV